VTGFLQPQLGEKRGRNPPSTYNNSVKVPFIALLNSATVYVQHRIIHGFKLEGVVRTTGMDKTLIYQRILSVLSLFTHFKWGYLLLKETAFHSPF